MIDMHSHILAQVDDGAETLDMSIKMIKDAIQQGITGMIATPHAYHPTYHVSKAAVRKGITQLQVRIQESGLDFKVLEGQELRIQEKTLDAVVQGEALSLADSDYALLELPSSHIPNFTIPMIQRLASSGIIPIIAHPERNKAIAEKPARLERLITNGALAQVTAGSVAGHFGKSTQKTALTLIRSNLIHHYGSDTHNLSTRPSLFASGLDYLDKQKLHDYVDLFLENNARIIEKKEPIILEPQVLEEKKWWKVFA